METELNWSKGEIENKIKNEWKKNQKRNFLFHIKIRRIAKRNGDKDIEHRPYWPE